MSDIGTINKITQRLGGVPPDPEGMNEKRAGWADAALQTFATKTGMKLDIEPEDVIPDLLTDLMHWCDRNDQDFDDRLRRAREHYEAETTPYE